MRVIETPVYVFAELSNAAKEKARQWYKDAMNEDFHFETESITESMQYIVEQAGFEVYGKHPVSWSLGYCQSDYVGIDADPGDGLIEALLTESLSEKDARWYRRLSDVMGISAKVNYHHYYGQQVSVEVSCDGDYMPRIYDLTIRVAEALEDALRDKVNDIRSEMMRLGYSEIEYYYADEQVDESIICNDYEFTEEGKRW